MATDVKRPRGRDEVLDAVLDAAERLFAAAGPAQVSLRAIAEEAGVNYGLVHRHFGTKDTLLDRMLQRFAERWRAQLGDAPGYLEALDALLGPSPDPGTYLRVLAWTLLSDPEMASAEAHRRHTVLDELPALAPGADAGSDTRADTAAALAFAFGWRFFNPFIRQALHLHDTDVDELQARMRSELHRIAIPEHAEQFVALHDDRPTAPRRGGRRRPG